MPTDNQNDIARINEERDEIILTLDAFEKKILDPIREKLQDPDGLSNLEANNILAENAKDNLARYSNQLIELRKLVDQAVGEGILGRVNIDLESYETKYKVLHKKVILAWAMDSSNDGELKKTAEAFDPFDDVEMEELKKRGFSRNEQLRKAAGVITSSEQMADLLDMIAADLTASDNADIPLDKIEDIRQILMQARTDFQTLININIDSIDNEQVVGQRLDRDDIRKLLENNTNRIRNFIQTTISKSSSFLYTDPYKAEKYYMPVEILEAALDPSSDLGLLTAVKKLRKNITEQKEKFDQSNLYLNEVKEAVWTLFDKPIELSSSAISIEASYTDLIEMIRKAWEVFPKNRELPMVLIKTIEKVYDDMQSYIANEKNEFSSSIVVLNNRMMLTEWRDDRLNRLEDPEWIAILDDRYKNLLSAMTEVQANITIQLGDLYTDTDIFADRSLLPVHYDYASIQEFSVQKAKNVNNTSAAYADLQKKLKDETVIRHSIRNKMIEIQALLDKALPKEAKSEITAFIEQFPMYGDDVEVELIQTQIQKSLDIPELILQAREEYSFSNWERCVRTTKIIMDRNKLPLITLTQQFDQIFIDKYLNDVTISELPFEIKIFVPVVHQLATINLAVERINDLWPNNEFLLAKKWLEDITKCGKGKNAIVKGLLSDNDIEGVTLEWVEREKFGNETIVNGVPLSTQGKNFQHEAELLLSESEQGINAIAWLKRADGFLDAIADFDKSNQTIWVGEQIRWKKEISKLFVIAFSNWVATIQTSADPADISDAHKFLDQLWSHRRFDETSHAQRHWIIINYYRNAANKIVDSENQDKLKIEQWRAALSELPSEEAIKKETRGALWLGWMHLLEEELNKFAQSPLHSDEIWQKLIAQDEATSPYIFAPIIKRDDQLGVQLPLEKDGAEYKNKISARNLIADSYRKIERSKENIEIVIRDLVLREKQFVIPALGKMASVLVEELVAKLTKDGEDLIIEHNIDKGIGNYLAAYFYSTTYGVEVDRCRTIISSNRENIDLFVNNLPSIIDRIDIANTPLQSCYSALSDLKTKIDALLKIHEAGLLQIPQSKTIESLLKVKTDKVKPALNWLTYFSPSNTAWQDAMDPSKQDTSRDSSWKILNTYGASILLRIPSQFQVKKIQELQNVIQDPSFELIDKYNTILSSVKSVDPDYLKILLSCSRVNSISDSLAGAEEELLQLWSIWEGNNPKYRSYYSRTNPVYENWSFVVPNLNNENLTVPYCGLEGTEKEHFNRIKQILRETTTQPPLRGEATRDQNVWNRFWQENKLLYSELCQRVDNNNFVLIDFLLVAVRDLEIWNNQLLEIESYHHSFANVLEQIKNQNKCQMVVDCIDQLQIISAEKIGKFNDSKDLRAYTLKSSIKKNSFIQHSSDLKEKNKDYSSLRDRYQNDYFETKQMFYDYWGIDSVRSNDERYQNKKIVRDLMIFMAQDQFAWSQEHDRAIGIDRDRILINHNQKFQPLYEYFRFVDGIVTNNFIDQIVEE